MKLPRDVSGAQLINALRRLGYQQDRQRGSHVRVTRQRDGEDHEAIPNHNAIKVGTLDHNRALTGPDLVEFVNTKLFPYLHGFKAKASGPRTLEYKIGEIFGEIKNKVTSGYNLREIIDQIDGLRFRSQTEKHELSHLYEAKIRNMGNAGRNGGEYYTPRPLIRAMVQVVAPKIGETIYDGACGSAGFRCESYEYLKNGGTFPAPVGAPLAASRAS
ncbi:MAG TPA: N-6 DNA methylase, partial [Opitutaceae bacterium]